MTPQDEEKAAKYDDGGNPAPPISFPPLFPSRPASLRPLPLPSPAAALSGMPQPAGSMKHLAEPHIFLKPRA